MSVEKRNLRFTIYDLRFTIYDLRFTIYDLRLRKAHTVLLKFMIYQLSGMDIIE
jgi:hypothetical protein